MAGKISFDEFSPLSKAEWIEQIIRDLKIKSFNEIAWTLDPGIDLDPFYHEDSKPFRLPLSYRTSQDWEILAYLRGVDLSEMESILDHDIRSIMITQPVQPEVFNSIKTSIPVRLHVICHSNKLSEMEESLNQISPCNIHIASLRLYDRPLVLRSSFTGDFRLDSNYIWIHNTNEHEVWTDNIAHQLNILCSNLDNLIGTKDFNRVKVIFSVEISDDFLKEIVKLRALNVLMANIWKVYGFSDETLPEIEGHVLSPGPEKDYHNDVIHNTTKALSAIIGGIDRLMIRPLETTDETKNRLFQRVNRNIHHILKVESFIDKITDPSAGSYLLDEGTRRLALSIWKKFKELRT